MPDQVGQADVKGENVARAVKGFALKLFKLKQVAATQKSSSWTESYYRETAADLSVGDSLSGSAGIEVQGTPRLAAFPHVDPSWTKVQGRQVKFAAEGEVSVEDNITDALDVQKRTILRVARAISSAVDTYMYTQLTAATGTSGVVASAAAWDHATVAIRDPIGDILAGISAMDENNYDVLQNGFLLLSPKDYKNLMRNSKVINNPSFKTADVVSNGVVGQICGLKIIKSNSVTADEAMIVMGQRACTWQTAIPMSSAVINDPGVKDTIRSWEIGHLQITDPQGLYTITNTQA